MNLDRAGGSDRRVDHRAVQQLLTAGTSGCAQHQLVSILVAGEIQHRGGDIDAGQFGVVATQFAEQPALAGQPCGLRPHQAGGFPHVHPDQLGADRRGDLRGPPQDVLARPGRRSTRRRPAAKQPPPVPGSARSGGRR